MYLLAGEKHTLRNLLDGIFLVSANDAAEAISEGTTGRREEFIGLMNSKAAQLGMGDTVFVNPTGLEEEPEKCKGRAPCQYSTALDVALMSRYLIKTWPEIINISSQPHVFIEKTTDHQDYDMYSGINLLTTYPGVLGLKTGYTPEAGLTLVTLARQNGKEVLGVLLGAGCGSFPIIAKRNKKNHPGAGRNTDSPDPGPGSLPVREGLDSRGGRLVY
jgi:D-alanyl-D-alanine carboxypeptidase